MAQDSGVLDVDAAIADSEPAQATPQRGRMRWLACSLRRHPAGLVGIVMLVVVLGIGAFGLVVDVDPLAQDLRARHLPPVWAGGVAAHPLGTDLLGRDVLARLAVGVQVSSLIVALAMAGAVTVGMVAGMAAGYFRGRIDAVIMRLADLQLAFPQLLLLLLVIGTFGPSLPTLVGVLSLSGWVVYARIVRSQTLAVTRMEYVHTAHALGGGPLHVLRRHVFPNTVRQVIVVGSFATANIVLVESALSFLGLGVPQPTPSLGGMIADGRAYLTTAPWLSVIPGLAIFALVIAVNLVGEWLRQVLDPRSAR